MIMGTKIMCVMLLISSATIFFNGSVGLYKNKLLNIFWPGRAQTERDLKDKLFLLDYKGVLCCTMLSYPFYSVLCTEFCVIFKSDSLDIIVNILASMKAITVSWLARPI